MPGTSFRRRLRPWRYCRVNRSTINHNMSVKFVKNPCASFPWGTVGRSQPSVLGNTLNGYQHKNRRWRET
jgi:hypothetical protein